MAHMHTLWGFRLPDEPEPIVLAAGTLRHVRSERRIWEAAGWTCDYYWSSAPPLRIRQRARNARPALAAVWGREKPDDPMTELARGPVAEMNARLLMARGAGWTAELRQADNEAQPVL